MSACPDAVALRQLLDGTLDGATSGTVVSHVGDCFSCQTALDELTASNLPTLPPRLRRPAARVPGPAEAGGGGPPERRAGGVPTIPGYDILELLGRGGMGAVAAGSLIGLTWLYLESETARKQSDLDRRTATDEATRALAEQAKAEKAEAGTKAMNEFLVGKVFAAPLPTDKGGLGKDTTVVQMLTAAAPQIDGAFPGQPENAAVVHRSFGEMFLAYGDYPTAKTHFEGYRKVFTLNHPSAYTIRSALGDIWHKQGKCQEALDHFTAVLAAYRQSQKANSPLIPFMQGRRGRSLAALGRFDEGERELLAAQKAYTESKVVSPRRRYEMVEHLAELYEKGNRPDDTAKWRAELAKMPKK